MTSWNWTSSRNWKWQMFKVQSEGREACKNPLASFPFICVATPAFSAFFLTLAMLMSSGTLLNSGINKLLPTLPGNLSDIMPGVTSLRPFATAPLNWGLQGLLHLPLLPSSLQQTSHLMFYTACMSGATQCSALCYWNYSLCPSPSEPAEESCAGFLTDLGHAETLPMYLHFSLIAFTRVSCKSQPSWITSVRAKIILPPSTSAACRTKSMCIIPEGSYQF